MGTPERLHAQQTSAAPVRVTNSASAPVPVTGNVTATVAGDVNATVTGNVNATVSGNVNATVTGPVALASGATVTVGNSTNSPVPVVDVGSARLPLQGPLRSCVFDYTHGACGVDMYTVPPGYRLVVEHVTAYPDVTQSARDLHRRWPGHSG